MKEFDKDLDEVLAADDKGKAAGTARYIDQYFVSCASFFAQIKVLLQI